MITTNSRIVDLRLSLATRPVELVRHWRDNGELLLDPPYQRGLVWGYERRRNLIYSIYRGIHIPSMIINDRSAKQRDGSYWDINICAAVIDGKQRISAILSFLDGDLVVPGAWFGLPTSEVTYLDLPLVFQRRFRTLGLMFAEARLPNLETEKEVFELINYGGVEQGETDL